MKTQTGTIDCTPSWMNVLAICLATIDQPTSIETLKAMSRYCEALRLAAIKEPELIQRILTEYMR